MAAELLDISDERLEPSRPKILGSERLSAEDGLALFQSHDLLGLGWLANHVREQRHGNVCYYNVNRHINPTNVCVAHCKLCAFGRSPDAPGAYTMSLEEVYAARRGGSRRGRHGIPHRRRPASRSSVRLLPRRDPRPEAALPAGAPESLHHGRGALLRAHLPSFRSRTRC